MLVPSLRATASDRLLLKPSVGVSPSEARPTRGVLCAGNARHHPAWTPSMSKPEETIRRGCSKSLHSVSNQPSRPARKPRGAPFDWIRTDPRSYGQLHRMPLHSVRQGARKVSAASTACRGTGLFAKAWFSGKRPSRLPRRPRGAAQGARLHAADSSSPPHRSVSARDVPAPATTKLGVRAERSRFQPVKACR